MTHIENKSICLLGGYDTVGELQTYQPLHEETSLYDQLHSLMQMVGGGTRCLPERFSSGRAARRR